MRILGKHSVDTHFPEDRNCEICQRTKIARAPCRTRNGGAVPRAENFGDLITAYHKVLSESCESRKNHRYAIVVQDLATQWIQAYPCKTKTSQETQRSLQKFLKPERKPKVIHTDNSIEFGKACEDLAWNHCTSTRHRSETKGIADRAVRRVKEGTSAVLLQSGLDDKWWADSMECYCYVRNIQDLLSDGKTPCERRFGMPFNGPVIPFGSMVEYHPISAKDIPCNHPFWITSPGPKNRIRIVSIIEKTIRFWTFEEKWRNNSSVRVVAVHTGTFWTYTRARFEWTHGGEGEGHRQFCLQKFARVGLSRDPEVHHR